ncbi:M48 family metalloprotease [Rhodobacteraceae bacterium KMM 6894]|nr:M48 family metalloprotease [Rhodobacteraceae bacterium KMM 6894]
MTLASPAHALSLLRDPDIEHALKQLAAPVLKSAGINPSRFSILLIGDRRLNAFVVDRDNVFFNFGLLLKMDSLQMIQGAIAHEAGHIANGHLVRRPVNLHNARTAAMRRSCVFWPWPMQIQAITAWPRWSRPSGMRWSGGWKMRRFTPRAPRACCQTDRVVGNGHRMCFLRLKPPNDNVLEIEVERT